MPRAHLLQRRGLLSKPTTQSYSQQVLAHANLQSYWRMGESAGTFADQKGALALPAPSGSGFTRADTGLITGDANGSFRRGNSTGAIVATSDLYRFGGTAAFTIEALVKINNAAAGSVFDLFRCSDGSGTIWRLGYTFSAGSLFRFDFSRRNSGGGSNSAGFSESQTMAAGTTRYHLAATFDGTTMKLFKTGVQMAGTATPGSATVSTGAQLFITGSSGGDYTIDEIAIYNAALSSAEVLAHATAMG